MKRLFAILFSFALILSQAAFLPLTENSVISKTSVPKCCGLCTGSGAKCCISRDGTAPRDPSPAIPSHEISQNDWQLLVPITVQFLPQISDNSLIFFSQNSVAPSFSAPVYQRNCSYLI